MKTQFIIIILSSILASACGSYNYLEKTKTAEEIKAVENRLEKIYNMYLGHFTNEEQAKTEESAIYKAQELISVPMWTKRSGEYWAYICRMQQGKTSDLLSQEVWQFKRKDPQTIKVMIYEVPNKSKYAADWKKKDPLSDLKPADLIYHGTCPTLITRGEGHNFKVKGEACKRNFSDVIKYIQEEGVLIPEGIVMYNKMLNVNKKEVFAYEKGIKFMRINKEEPRY